MAITEVVGRYYEARYNYHIGPEGVKEKRGNSFAESETLEGNCQWFTHAILEELGVSLPRHMRSKELFEDETMLRIVEEEPLKPGDIAFLRPKKRRSDPKELHLAICIVVNSYQTLFAHIINGDGVSLWDLSEFINEDPYELVAVKRLIPPHHEILMQNI